MSGLPGKGNIVQADMKKDIVLIKRKVYPGVFDDGRWIYIAPKFFRAVNLEFGVIMGYVINFAPPLSRNLRIKKS